MVTKKAENSKKAGRSSKKSVDLSQIRISDKAKANSKKTPAKSPSNRSNIIRLKDVQSKKLQSPSLAPLESNFDKQVDEQISKDIRDAISVDPSFKEELTAGAYLKSVRISKKIALSTISSELRIREDYLENIESQESSALPEKVYALGFVRSYADYLGLDKAQLVEKFKSEVYGTQACPKTRKLSVPKPVTTSLLPSKRLVYFCTIVLLVLGCAFWYWNRVNQESPEQEIQNLLSESKSIAEKSHSLLDSTSPMTQFDVESPNIS